MEQTEAKPDMDRFLDRVVPGRDAGQNMTVNEMVERLAAIFTEIKGLRDADDRGQIGHLTTLMGEARGLSVKIFASCSAPFLHGLPPKLALIAQIALSKEVSDMVNHAVDAFGETAAKVEGLASALAAIPVTGKPN